MSSRSTGKSASAVLENPDDHAAEASGAPTSSIEKSTDTECEQPAAHADTLDSIDDIPEATDTVTAESTAAANTADSAGAGTGAEADSQPETLARQLEQLVRSVSVVEELSRHA